MLTIPRLIIAAPNSGSGKTTVSSGLMAAFRARGLHVAPFKAGPDYIDPSYHTFAAGQPSHNLDSWMLSETRVQALFEHRAQGADLALMEGVMGLFDGFSSGDDTGSTAHLARLLDVPVLLVIDIGGMASSAAALAKGFYEFDPRVRIAGFLLNRAGGERHAQWVKEAIERVTDKPVVGYLMGDNALTLPERHLGLIPTYEPGRWQEWLTQTQRQIETTVDLDKVLELARSATPFQTSADSPFHITATEIRARIAVARDAAFNFLYDDNLDLLRAAGAEIVFFSPLHDSVLPENIGALYLCGGFPELYAADLAANRSMLASIRSAFADGLPIYAECGGLMALTESIVDGQGNSYPMAGLLPGKSVMSDRLTLGYRTVQAQRDSWLWAAGDTLRGHEFHYSNWVDCDPDLSNAYNVVQSQPRSEGAQIGYLIASYIHLHFLAAPDLAERMVTAAQHRAERR